MEEKSILITGCSSGIGLSAATLLKQRGYRVFATARKPQDVLNLKNKGFESIELDVNHSDSITNALEQILSWTGGRLYALFNNAGYLQAGAIEDLTRELNRAQFETNVFGPMELIARVLPIMRQQGYGRIIQNSSILGVVTIPYTGAYNASKFALEGFSRTLWQELAGTQIFVSLINPGPIESKLWDHAYEKFQESLHDRRSDSQFADAYEQMEKSYFQQKNAKLASDPSAVVKNLIHALESKRPRIHYFVGVSAKSVAILRRFLPEALLDRLLIKAR